MSNPPGAGAGYTNEDWSGRTFGQNWGAMIRSAEETPVLKWPRSNRSYRLMMNDSQIAALYAMTTLQIRGFRYFIDPNGCDLAIVKGVARDVGLPVDGEDQQVKRASTLGFDFKRHLYHALKTIIPGHSYFEITGEIMEDGKWHLARTGFRPPETIDSFVVNRDGSLEMIKQRPGARASGWGLIEIPADHLLAYLWDAEDGDWIGRSMLRSCYRDWLVKDRLIRVNAINIERGGGIPWAKAQPGANGRQMRALAEVARDFKVDAEGGASLPDGSELHIEKTSTPDAINSIRYHDESMARAWLAMFAMLGQTQTGSRALGSTFVDFFALGQQAIADDLVCEGFNKLIRRMVEWNYGPQESYPLLAYDVPDGTLPVADLVALIEQGALIVDDEVRAWLSEAYNLPRQTVPDETPQVASFGYDLDSAIITIDERRAQLGLPPRIDGEGSLTVPEFLAKFGPQPAADPISAPEDVDGVQIESRAGRSRSRIAAEGFRRELTAVESSAGLDPTRLQEDHDGALEALLATYRDEMKPDLVEQIKAQIEDADGDAAKLAEIKAVADSDKLKAKLKQAYEDGHASHVAEAKAQGVEIDEAAEDADAGSRAAGLGGLLAVGLGVSAVGKALSLTGTGLAPSEVATQVSTFLTDLKDSAAESNIRGAVTRAINGGRIAAIKTALATKAGTVYASELLDQNTCSACSEIDGKQYDSIEDAEIDYPAGPYVNCEGQDNCRGTLIVEYEG